MKLLIKNVRVVTETATLPATDILVENGKICAIGANLTPSGASEVWHFENALVTVGWLDVGTQVGEPGFEHLEDLQTVDAAAAAGGFTGIACFPNTQPVLHSKSEIQYILNQTKESLVNFYPVGAVSQHAEGKDLAELFDMHQAGAVAFSDGKKAIQDAGLLLRALQYSQAFGGCIFNMPFQKSIASGGQIHEGLLSTQMGLRGIASLAEELMVQRDLSLLEYAGGRLHLHLLSTEKSVEMVRNAKQKGLPVTASVAVANLCFIDAELQNFDTNWKVLPPLRADSDRLSLIEGVKDGTIDFICSNHIPHDAEAKNLEFPYADFGMIGLETAFSICLTYLNNQLTINQLVDKWAIQPRKVLGLPIPKIEVGSEANFFVFDAEKSWQFTRAGLKSKSDNSPFLEKYLKGKVLGMVRGTQAAQF